MTSTINSLNNTNCFKRLIKIQNNNQQIKALLDTGAEISCIDMKLAKALKLIYNGQRVIQGYNNKLETVSYIRNLNISLNNCNFEGEFVVVNDLCHSCIIGGELLRQILKQFTIDYLVPKSNNYKINSLGISNEWDNVMASSLSESTHCKVRPIEIKTSESVPISSGRIRVGFSQDKIIEEEVQKLLKSGIIRPSSSPWSSSVVLSDKKDGSIRLCVDYRPLNDVTVRDSYPLPLIDEILDSLGKAKIFTTLDAISGYHQIPIREEDKPKTAFLTKSGLYEYNRLPFGLKNGPAAFQRAMDEMFREYIGKFLHVYLDDIIVFSESMEEHENHLNLVLEKIKSYRLKLKSEKCLFKQKELEILGYKVGNGQVSLTDSRIQSIKDYPIPSTIKELRSFLGLATYCRNFV